MPLLKNNTLISDTWIHAGADDQLPEAGDVIVPFASLLREFESLSKRSGKLGVVFSNVDRADALARGFVALPDFWQMGRDDQLPIQVLHQLFQAGQQTAHQRRVQIKVRFINQNNSALFGPA